MLVGVALCCIYYVFFSSRRRHTRCALVTGVQSCALPISGVVHTLRAIPEACARLQGEFTGDAAQPYRFAAVRTSATCQPRARLVDAAKARPSVQARSEERRVGKEWGRTRRYWGSTYQSKKNIERKRLRKLLNKTLD